MFVVIARYKVQEKNHMKFLEESKQYYFDRFRRASGFVDVKILKNILDKEFIDILTEWQSKEDFMNFINAHQKEGVIKFSVPVEVLERYLYDVLE